MAEQLALFGVIVGIALLLSGIGFIVLAAFGMVRLAATAAQPVTARGTGQPSRSSGRMRRRGAGCRRAGRAPFTFSR